MLLALLLSGVACSDDSEGPKKEGESDPVTLTLSDPNATEETKALYSNLWAIQSKGFMFGHHDDLMYGRTWYGTEGGSDIGQSMTFKFQAATTKFMKWKIFRIQTMRKLLRS